MIDLIFVHLEQLILEVDRVAVGAQGAGLAVDREAGSWERGFGAATLDRGLEAVGKILGDVHPLVAGGFDVGDVGSQGLLTEDAGIQGPLRNAHVEAGLDSLDHASR